MIKAVQKHSKKDLKDLDSNYSQKIITIRNEYYRTDYEDMDFLTEVQRLKSLEAEFYEKAGLLDYFEKEEAEKKNTERL